MTSYILLLVLLSIYSVGSNRTVSVTESVSEVPVKKSDKTDDIFYEEYEYLDGTDNGISSRIEKKENTTGTDGFPAEVFLSLRNITPDAATAFRSFTNRNDVNDLQASASDNLNVTSNDTFGDSLESAGVNLRALRDAGHPPEILGEAQNGVYLPYKHAKIDTADLSDCALQGEWKPMGVAHSQLTVSGDHSHQAEILQSVGSYSVPNKIIPHWSQNYVASGDQDFQDGRGPYNHKPAGGYASGSSFEGNGANSHSGGGLYSGVNALNHQYGGGAGVYVGGYSGQFQKIKSGSMLSPPPLPPIIFGKKPGYWKLPKTKLKLHDKRKRPAGYAPSIGFSSHFNHAPNGASDILSGSGSIGQYNLPSTSSSLSGSFSNHLGHGSSAGYGSGGVSISGPVKGYAGGTNFGGQVLGGSESSFVGGSISRPVKGYASHGSAGSGFGSFSGYGFGGSGSLGSGSHGSSGGSGVSGYGFGGASHGSSSGISTHAFKGGSLGSGNSGSNFGSLSHGLKRPGLVVGGESYDSGAGSPSISLPTFGGGSHVSGSSGHGFGGGSHASGSSGHEFEGKSYGSEGSGHGLGIGSQGSEDSGYGFGGGSYGSGHGFGGGSLESGGDSNSGSSTFSSSGHGFGISESSTFGGLSSHKPSISVSSHESGGTPIPSHFGSGSDSESSEHKIKEHFDSGGSSHIVSGPTPIPLDYVESSGGGSNQMISGPTPIPLIHESGGSGYIGHAIVSPTPIPLVHGSENSAFLGAGTVHTISGPTPIPLHLGSEVVGGGGGGGVTVEHLSQNAGIGPLASGGVTISSTSGHLNLGGAGAAVIGPSLGGSDFSLSSGHGTRGVHSAGIASNGDSLKGSYHSGGGALDSTFSSTHINQGIGKAVPDAAFLSSHVNQDFVVHGHGVSDDLSSSSTFTCGKNHDHNTNYHTATFQVADHDHPSSIDVLQYQGDAAVLIQASKTPFHDQLTERKQYAWGEKDDSDASSTDTRNELSSEPAQLSKVEQDLAQTVNDAEKIQDDEEPERHSYYHEITKVTKIPATSVGSVEYTFSQYETKPQSFKQETESNEELVEQPQIIKELEQLSNKFQLDLENPQKLFEDPPSQELAYHYPFHGVEVHEEIGDGGHKLKEEIHEVTTEYPQYEIPNRFTSKPVFPAAYHKPQVKNIPRPGKPQFYQKTQVNYHQPRPVVVLRKTPPKQYLKKKQNYEVHEHFGERRRPVGEIFPPQKFPKQFHNPKPNFAVDRPKNGWRPSGDFRDFAYDSYHGKKIKKYKTQKIVAPVLIRRPVSEKIPVIRVLEVAG